MPRSPGKQVDACPPSRAGRLAALAAKSVQLHLQLQHGRCVRVDVFTAGTGAAGRHAADAGTADTYAGADLQSRGV